MQSVIRLPLMTTTLLGMGLACSALAQDYAVPADTREHIRSAVESDQRTSAQRERDVARRPAEVLSLVGIEEGDQVVELGSFGHYYTTMLAEAVGPSGHVYLVDMPWIEPFGGEGARAFDAAHDNATFVQSHYNEVELPRNVDIVMMVLFYHDLLREAADEAVDTEDMNRRIYESLAPGGAYLVIDHSAESSSGWRDAMTLHRVDRQTVIDEVTAAGFELEVDHDLFANPEDDRSRNMRDPEIRGETDRFLLIFRKPE